jgi:hypothetical protein
MPNWESMGDARRPYNHDTACNMVSQTPMPKGYGMHGGLVTVRKLLHIVRKYVNKVLLGLQWMKPVLLFHYNISGTVACFPCMVNLLVDNLVICGRQRISMKQCVSV